MNLKNRRNMGLASLPSSVAPQADNIFKNDSFWSVELPLCSKDKYSKRK